MRLKIDVTPLWWKMEANTPETFADWCVKAVRVILSVWSRAEVRLSREKLVAIVTFDREERVGQAQADKSKIRMMLAAIVGMDDMQPKAFAGRSASDPVWQAINKYVRACGGDPGPMTTGVPRMDAVVEIEKAIDADRGRT